MLGNKECDSTNEFVDDLRKTCCKVLNEVCVFKNDETYSDVEFAFVLLDWCSDILNYVSKLKNGVKNNKNKNN